MLGRSCRIFDVIPEQFEEDTKMTSTTFGQRSFRLLIQFVKKHENTYELVELRIPARRATRHKENREECFAPLYSMIFDAATHLKRPRCILADSRIAQGPSILDLMKSPKLHLSFGSEIFQILSNV